jgi:hypothetical protein
MTSARLPSDFQAVDGGDVRMVQRRQRPGFTLETRQPVGIVRDRVGEDLDRDLAAEVGIGRAPHLAHAAGADLGSHFIRAEPRARGQRHGMPVASYDALPLSAVSGRSRSLRVRPGERWP